MWELIGSFFVVGLMTSFFCKKLEKNSYSRWGMCWYIFITIEIGNLFNGVFKIMTWVLICIVRELLLIIF
jgi:hypothetical protein